jgi:putative membrane protein
MAGESGEEFDKGWLKEMMGLHDETIEKFEKRMEDTNDAELKAYISKTLPVLRKHHESLEACNEKLKKKS